MAFKLLDMTQQRWRRLDGGHLPPLVRADAKFVDGVRQDRRRPYSTIEDRTKGGRLITTDRSTTLTITLRPNQIVVYPLAIPLISSRIAPSGSLKQITPIVAPSGPLIFLSGATHWTFCACRSA
jgi:hypothetical protein